MKNGNVMGFRGYRFFSPKSSKAKYKTLGTSEANFGGKKPRIILREVRYPGERYQAIWASCFKWSYDNRILQSWSCHVKFMNLVTGSVHKFHMK